MAVFGQQEEYKNRLDWQILRDGSIALYLRQEYLNEDADWLRQHDYQVFACDCTQWTTEEAMHTGFQRTLSFPDYYGKNADALKDCLYDLPVPETGGMALVLNRFDAYAKGTGMPLMHSKRTEAEVVLDILAGASRDFLLTGRRFLTLVQSNDPHLRFERLGGMTTQWNRREWLNKNRGV
ncbi:MAG TPA: barstar family protein [Terriglobales bacterium]|jgi:hypothetical protein|nr:barstar family protein [Terriglobales bacterium]